jgi:enoyl-CoA hydratase/carnithine racemase
VYDYPAPIVAHVNGHAIAGGCLVALACDWRVAAPSPSTKIGLNEVALGLRFPPRILAMVKQRVPPQHHTEVLLGARLFDPAGALQAGVVDEVVEDARAVAEARLAALGKNPGEAYALTKEDLRGTAQDLCPDSAWDQRLRGDVAGWTSPELKQKIAAMLAR